MLSPRHKKEVAAIELMDITLYKCTSPKMNGEIVLTFHDGYVYNILFRLSGPLTPEQFSLFKQNIPFTEYHFHGFANACGLHYVSLKEVPAMEKIAAFQNAYRQYLGIDYVRQGRDHLVIKNFDVTEPLLKTYFTSTNVLFKNHHSIGNYAKFYNQLRAENAGAYTKSRFPSFYDRNFERTIKTQQEQQEWFAHLRVLGYKPKKHQGQIVDWIKENA
jgi:hypothetical protein